MTGDYTRSRSLNKPAYYVFTASALIFLLLKNYDSAATFAGIALIFDPFNTEQPYAQRPFYQRLWLTVHVVFALVCFGLLFFL